MNGTEFVWGLLIKGSVVIGLAWLACLALRRSSASTRHAVWLGALGALILLPVIALLPKWNVSVERSQIVRPLLSPLPEVKDPTQVMVAQSGPSAAPAHSGRGIAGQDRPGYLGRRLRLCFSLGSFRSPPSTQTH